MRPRRCGEGLGASIPRPDGRSYSIAHVPTPIIDRSGKRRRRKPESDLTIAHHMSHASARDASEGVLHLDFGHRRVAAASRFPLSGDPDGSGLVPACQRSIHPHRRHAGLPGQMRLPIGRSSFGSGLAPNKFRRPGHSGYYWSQYVRPRSDARTSYTCRRRYLLLETCQELHCFNAQPFLFELTGLINLHVANQFAGCYGNACGMTQRFGSQKSGIRDVLGAGHLSLRRSTELSRRIWAELVRVPK